MNFIINNYKNRNMINNNIMVSNSRSNRETVISNVSQDISDIDFDDWDFDEDEMDKDMYKCLRTHDTMGTNVIQFIKGKLYQCQNDVDNYIGNYYITTTEDGRRMKFHKNSYIGKEIFNIK